MTKKIIRVKLQKIFRRTRLLSLVEKLRYYFKIWSNRKSNKRFFKENPGFLVPPSYLAFDAYSAPAWNFYKNSGEGTAEFLKEMVEKHFTPCGQPLSAVYEWGCGPARVIRHLPAQFGNTVSINGSDYNAKTIEWCKRNIPNVHFSLNKLNPPLVYADNIFDIIYCISVFTHLSDKTGINWANELFRVLKPGGILIMTTSGDNVYHTELLAAEKKKYKEEGIVVRGEYEEGKKMFLTRHNPEYVKKNLLKRFELIEHIPAGFPYIDQDCWIARKTV